MAGRRDIEFRIKALTEGVAEVKQLESEIRDLHQEAGKRVPDRTKSFRKGLDKAARSAGQLTTQIAKIGGAAAATGLGVAAYQAAQTAREFENVQRQAEAFGTSATRITELRFAFQEFGLEQQDVRDALSTTAERAQDAIDGTQGMVELFNKAGIEVEQLRGKNPVELLRLVAEGISRTDSESAQAQIAVGLLGDEVGQQLLPLLVQGADGFDRMAEKGERLNQVFDNTETAKMAQLSQTLRDVKNTIDGEFTQLVADNAEQIEALAKSMASAADSTVDFLNSVTGGTDLAQVENAIGRRENQLTQLRSIQQKAEDQDILDALNPLANVFDNAALEKLQRDGETIEDTIDRIEERQRDLQKRRKRILEENAADSTPAERETPSVTPGGVNTGGSSSGSSGGGDSDTPQLVDRLKSELETARERYERQLDTLYENAAAFGGEGSSEFQRAQQHLRDQFHEAKQAAKEQADATDEARDANLSYAQSLADRGLSAHQKYRRAVDRLRQAYKQNAQFSETEYTRALSVVRERYRDAQQSAESAADSTDEKTEAEREAARVLEGLETAQDRYNSKVDKYQRLLEKGLITEEQKIALQKKARKELEQSGEQADETGDEMSEYAKQARRSIQGELADGLASGFDDGLDSMVDSFASTMQQMIAEAAAADILDALLGDPEKKGEGILGSALDSLLGSSGSGSGSGGSGGGSGWLESIGSWIGSAFSGGSSGGSASMSSGSTSGGGSGGSGWMSAIGSIVGAFFHEGGIAGAGNAPTRELPASTWAGAPRYHSGGLAGDEVPAILRRGEEVLPESSPRHRDNAGDGEGSTIVNMSVNTPDAASFKKSSKAVARDARLGLMKR